MAVNPDDTDDASAGLMEEPGQAAEEEFTQSGRDVQRVYCHSSSGNSTSQRSVSAAHSRCGQSVVSAGTMTRTPASAPRHAISVSSR